MDAKRPSSTVFHESDYHTPSPRNKRSNKLLERKSSACLCTVVAVILVVAVLLGVTIGLRVTGTRNSLGFEETLGDTRLITFNPYYCRGVHLESPDSVASMYVLDYKPPLTGWSNITIDGSFAITESEDYINYYGWYDYGDYYYVEDLEYVAWEFHLNSGSEIRLEACLDTSDADGFFLLAKGKDNYNSWGESLADAHEIPQCSPVPAAEKTPLVDLKVSKSNEYYFIFYSPNSDVSPRLNLTLNLHRTEYNIDSEQKSSCNTTTQTKSCSLHVPLGSQKYALLVTTNRETESIKYGDKASLTWICRSRDWVYVVIFFCPIIFFVSLFIAMYIIFVMFSNRKLRSYKTLRNETNAENNGNYRIVYDKPKKQTTNLI